MHFPAENVVLQGWRSGDGNTGAQLTLSTPRTTLGTVIKQIQSQSKYQFFYNDKLSTVTVEPLKVKDASLEQVLNTLLKNKDISYKIEENIIYLSEKENSDSLQQQSMFQSPTISRTRILQTRM